VILKKKVVSARQMALLAHVEDERQAIAHG
jgi:hypothetical protein